MKSLAFSMQTWFTGSSFKVKDAANLPQMEKNISHVHRKFKFSRHPSRWQQWGNMWNVWKQGGLRVNGITHHDDCRHGQKERWRDDNRPWFSELFLFRLYRRHNEAYKRKKQIMIMNVSTSFKLSLSNVHSMILTVC